jgi:flagellar hook protein FlgE
MSLYGVMRTSTSGMSAQASRLSTVAENVANANTTGYKSARSEFSSLFIESNVSSYNSGSVDVDVRRLIGNQGTLVATSSQTDMAVQGEGFFIVRDSAGGTFLTRAGSFVPAGGGELVNAAGFTLMGYPLTNGAPTVVVNNLGGASNISNGLQPVIMNNLQLTAQPTTTGTFSANLPSDAALVAAGALPSTNVAAASFTAKSSLVAYGNLGEEVIVDIYFAKSATGTWDVSVYDRAAAPAAGGFPYSSGPLASATLTFDPSNGTVAAASPSSISFGVPGGSPATLDLSGMSQLAAGYNVLEAEVNGNSASAVELVEVADDGTIYVAFENGIRQSLYRIPLATVISPDKLNALSGNVFAPTSKSGDVRIGFPGEPGYGAVRSGTLEQSTADIASEFTDMIDAQRGYTANSKVFQTGAELMDVLVNLKR